METVFYLRVNGHVSGPYSLKQTKDLLTRYENAELSADSVRWFKTDDLLLLIPREKTIGPIAPVSDPAKISCRSRTVYLLLAGTLGIFGSHNFYIGRIAKGSVQCLLTFPFLIGLVVVPFWVLFEMFLEKTDADGNFLQ